MKMVWKLAFLPGCLVISAGFMVVALLLMKVLWAWTVPDLFPGAVEQGLVARNIGWLTSLKLALFIGVLGGASLSLRGRK